MSKKYTSKEGSIYKQAWQKFCKNKLSLVALYFILLCGLVALAGYLITPDSTPYANEQNLVLMNKKPGFNCKFLKVRKNEPDVSKNFIHTMLWGKHNPYVLIPITEYYFDKNNIVVREFTGQDTSVRKYSSFHILDVVHAIGIRAKNYDTLANLIYYTDIYGNRHGEFIHIIKENIEKNFIINKRFILGTDRFGRDLLSQLIIGTRVSLSVGFIAVLLSITIGILLGSIAGYYKGWVDNLIMWFINVVWSIPTLLLVIAISFVLGKGFWQIFIAVGLTMWVEVARVVRGEVLSLREKDYVEAARALGFSNFRIISRHIIPNVMGSVVVISAANFASAILIEAGLSFLGLGVQPPVPSWGTMIKEHYGYIVLDMAYLAILPGLAILLLVLAFMLVGNGLRDALDVKANIK